MVCPYTYSYVKKMITNYLLDFKRVGITNSNKLSPHGIRHSFATHLNNNGGSFYRTFTINEIRGYMQIGDDEYTRYFNLKNKVINPSLKEINDHSDITIISIEEIKKGRSIYAVTITAEPKKQMVMDIREDIPEQEKSGGITRTNWTVPSASIASPSFSPAGRAVISK